ncbi:MAG: response regulator, partial [Bilophila sp.]
MTPEKKPSVLIVDDDPGHRVMLEALLAKWGYAPVGVCNGREAVDKIQERPFDVTLMDIRMPDMDGITALKAIKNYNPAVPVVLMTAYSTVESAIEALKAGAFDYLLKPLDFDMLRTALGQTLEHQRRPDDTARAVGDDKIVGKSPAIERMRELIHTVAASEATVLVTGQSGTG